MKLKEIDNFITQSNQRLIDELVEPILETPYLKLERIVSQSHATPPGQWYDQIWPEWVLLLQGSAALLMENDADPIVLRPGDYLTIPAHARHRVEWTDPDQDTIWLALHHRTNHSR